MVCTVVAFVFTSYTCWTELSLTFDLLCRLRSMLDEAKFSQRTVISQKEVNRGFLMSHGQSGIICPYLTACELRDTFHASSSS